MAPIRAGIALLAALLAVGSARAEPVLDRVRRVGVVHCGGAAGPGLASPDADGAWQGLLVDVCRAIGVAVLGRSARTVYHPYVRDADFAGSGGYDVVFLTDGEMIGQHLLGTLLPGPAVFYRTIGLAVDQGSSVRAASDIGRRSVCFEPGSTADRAVEAYFGSHGLALHPMPFQEAEEMLDAFGDGRCGAMAGETIALVQSAADLGGRILPDIVSARAVEAASTLADGPWAAVIRWTVATLLRAEANGGRAAPDQGMPLLPIDAPSLGLAGDWQVQVVDDVGDYGTIYRRNFGDGLPRGPNALAEAGGWLVAPASE